MGSLHRTVSFVALLCLVVAMTSVEGDRREKRQDEDPPADPPAETPPEAPEAPVPATEAAAEERPLEPTP